MTMQKYARLGKGAMSGVVIETWQAPDDNKGLNPDLIFIPWLAAEFVKCPDEVERDWTYDAASETYARPEVAP